MAKENKDSVINPIEYIKSLGLSEEQNTMLGFCISCISAQACTHVGESIISAITSNEEDAKKCMQPVYQFIDNYNNSLAESLDVLLNGKEEIGDDSNE